MLIHTCTFQYSLIPMNIPCVQYIQIQTDTYQYRPLHTIGINTYQYTICMPIHIDTHQYRLIPINMYNTYHIYNTYHMYNTYKYMSIHANTKCQYMPNTYHAKYLPIHSTIHTMKSNTCQYVHISYSDITSLMI